MHKRELFVLGVISMAVLLFLFVIGGRSFTGAFVDDTNEVYELGTEAFHSMPLSAQQLPQFTLATPHYNPALLPPRGYLEPSVLSFAVNRIPIVEPNPYAFIPLKKDQLHTYSGSAGYYLTNPLPYVQGSLCAFAYKIRNAPLRCERVDLAYADGMVRFAAGYAEDEYIGHQAAGTDFAAVFILSNPDYGILATSPVAYLRWVNT